MAVAASAALFALFAIGLGAGRRVETALAVPIAAFDVPTRPHGQAAAPEHVPVAQVQTERTTEAQPAAARVADTRAVAAPKDPTAPGRPARETPAASIAAAPPLPTRQAPAAEEDALSAYAGRLRILVMAQRPAGTKGGGEVSIRFRVARDGALVDCVVERGSGTALLDRTALRMVRRAAPFPAPDPAISEAQLVFSLPIRFH